MTVEQVTFSTKRGLDSRFLDTICFVEATSFESNVLWSKNSLENNPKSPYSVMWEEDRSGLSKIVSHLDGRPVWVSFYWATINKYRVCFYTSGSQVVDWKAIEEWIETNVPRKFRTKRCMYDAQNFHHCLNLISDFTTANMTIVTLLE